MPRAPASSARWRPIADAIPAALERLAGLPAARALEEAAAHLAGSPSERLSGLDLDGRLLEAIAARALDGERGALFTNGGEARVLAVFALAEAAARRGGPSFPAGVSALLDPARPEASLRRALDGLAVLDPACGGGSLLAAAHGLASRAGARLRLSGLEIAPLAARAASLRLALLGADATVRSGNALSRDWPPCDVLLMNPPFLRHESLPESWKERAVRRSGLSRQADLSSHLVLLALRHSPVCGLVLPRAIETSRSAAPLRGEALARGGWRLSLRSRSAGSFAASVDTALAVWSEGAASLPAAEATVPLDRLPAAELSALSRGRGGRHLVVTRPARSARSARSARRPARRLADLCEVRFGMKTGANGFFHLRPLGGGRYRSALAGEVRLEATDVAPLLSGLRDAVAPEVARISWVLFRPGRPSALALDYLRRGEALGVNLRATCASRRNWWQVAPGRDPAPVLYPAKVGTRAFAFHNRDALLEDKKWHALFPREIAPWLLSLLLSSTPLRLAVDRGARQLTGAQAIADIDCGVLAAIPFPDPGALAPLEATLRALHAALARDPVTTDLAAMLARPAQRDLDLTAGAALGMSPTAVEKERSELLRRSAERLDRAAQVRRAIAQIR